MPTLPYRTVPSMLILGMSSRIVEPLFFISCVLYPLLLLSSVFCILFICYQLCPVSSPFIINYVLYLLLLLSAVACVLSFCYQL